MIKIRIYGLPAPQGSKRHVGKGIMVESSKRVKPWRQDVKFAALSVYTGGTLDETLKVKIQFIFPRPKSHFRTGKNASKLKEKAPRYVTSRGCGDIEKLVRSTLDALSASSGGASVMRDDSQVAVLSASKRYAHAGERSGAVVVIELLDDDYNP